MHSAVNNDIKENEMEKVTSDMSMSLDGFIAGLNDGPKNPLGDGGERLHQWMYGLTSFHKLHSVDPRTGKPFTARGKANGDDRIFDEMFKNTGAVIMGRRMFNNGVPHWGDNPPFHVPVFVLTHTAQDLLVKQGGTTFTFVVAGIEKALEQAKAAAGYKNVSVAGGANVVQQYLKAGLLDEIQIHLVHVLLGYGIRLFENIGTRQIELEKSMVIDSTGVTHVKFHVVK